MQRLATLTLLSFCLSLPTWAQTARLQVIHNSADAAAVAVDIYVNGSLYEGDFAFRTATAFSDVPAGVDLEVGIAPAGSNGPEDIIPGLEYTFNLPEDGTFVLVANGIVSGSGYNPVQPFDLYAVGGQESSDAGTTGVLVFHGATDAPAVDVFESAVLGANAVTDLSYGEFAGYLTLPTADYVLEVRAAGDPNTLVAYSAPLATLGLGGTSLVALASGFLDPSQNSDGPAFGIWVALPTGGDLIPLPVVEPETPTARLQVIHNSADAAAAAVDIYVNGSLYEGDFAFRTATEFRDVPAGVDLEVGIAPAGSNGPEDIIPGLEYTFNLPEDGTFVLVANGIVSGSGYNPVQPFDLYAVGGQESSDAGTTGVLVFHGATDAPAVDVFESAVLGANAVTDLSYGEFAGYLTLPTADYVLEVRAAGDPNTLVAYSAPLATLGLGGTSLVALASGFLDPSQNSDGPAFGIWVALPTGGDLIPLPVFEPPTSFAKLQVIHNSADAAAAVVDVYVNNALYEDDFAFRTATEFRDVPAGVDLEVGIAPGNSTGPQDIIPGLTFTFNLDEDQSYIVVANGIVSAGGYTPNVPFDLHAFVGAREEATVTSNTDLLVFHGATDAPTVDVAETAVLGGVTLIDDLAYAAFSGYLSPPTNDYVFEIRTADGTPVVAYSAPLSTLGLDGAALTVLASGFLNPANNSNGPAFGLWVASPAGGDLLELPVFTNVRELEAMGLNAWPNPANDLLFIDMDITSTVQASIMLTDMTGRPVRSMEGMSLASGESRIVMDVNGLSSGLYHLSIVGQDAVRTLPIQIMR